MELKNSVVVITGAAGGIGAALAHRFAAEGAAEVVVADRDRAAVEAVAEAIGPVAVPAQVDVAMETEVRALVTAAVERNGRIDLFCANAGITTGVGLEATDEEWQRAWSVNVLSHVYGARAVLPGMLARGEGYLLHTCSAAGLLTAVDDAPYSVTKHAAVAFAEWLAITYGDRGIRVSALCPQGVDTAMLREGLALGHRGAQVTAASGPVLTADQVAETTVAALAEERFLILTHPEVAVYESRRTQDRDRWLATMRRMATDVEAR